MVIAFQLCMCASAHGHVVVTWWSHGGHVVQWSHGGHIFMVATWLTAARSGEMPITVVTPLLSTSGPMPRSACTILAADEPAQRQGQTDRL